MLSLLEHDAEITECCCFSITETLKNLQTLNYHEKFNRYRPISISKLCELHLNLVIMWRWSMRLMWQCMLKHGNRGAHLHSVIHNLSTLLFILLGKHRALTMLWKRCCISETIGDIRNMIMINMPWWKRNNTNSGGQTGSHHTTILQQTILTESEPALQSSW